MREDAVKPRRRHYDLGIWALGFGYFIFYTPYSGLTKALTRGLFSTIGPVSGFEVLPVSILGTTACMFGFITAMGWWKYARRVEVFGITVPLPTRSTFLSGACLGGIIATTTRAFSFSGASIVLILVLLRAGVLVLGPMVDALFKRRVRWFSWMAMGFSLVACAVALADNANYTLGLIGAVDIAIYLTSYFFRLRLMTRLAKSNDRGNTIRYFVEEQITATPLLFLVLVVLACVGRGEMLSALRQGFTSLPGSQAVVVAVLIGASYAALCVCTTFIFLDRRENTFSISMHAATSLLSGVAAALALTWLYDQPPTSAAQYGSAGLMIIALAFLSPFHHLRWSRQRVERTLADNQLIVLGSIAGSGEAGFSGVQTNAVPESGMSAGKLESKRDRLYLFVCRANTLRSPMAQQICAAEIASCLGVSIQQLEAAGIRVLSAGIAARPGEAMSPEGERILAEMGVPVQQHASKLLTVNLIEQAETIYCMTEEQRQAVIDLVPAAAVKTHRLDPDEDLAESHEPGAITVFAERVRELIRRRFATEMSFSSLPR